MANIDVGHWETKTSQSEQCGHRQRLQPEDDHLMWSHIAATFKHASVFSWTEIDTCFYESTFCPHSGCYWHTQHYPVSQLFSVLNTGEKEERWISAHCFRSFCPWSLVPAALNSWWKGTSGRVMWQEFWCPGCEEKRQKKGPGCQHVLQSIPWGPIHSTKPHILKVPLVLNSATDWDPSP